MSTVLSRTLLVIEDADTCANMLELALDGLPGFRVERVTSAEAGLDVLRGANVAAIVTDVELPGMSGLELVTCVRQVPVVVVSATTDPDVQAKAIAAGASAFFAKPFSPSAIRRKMEELLKE